MIRGLLEKELRQHATLILFMLILLTVGLLMLQRTEVLARSMGSEFGMLAWLLLVFLPPSCLVLGNALIAGEFRHRTQIFLEGLPMPRWMMIAVKYVLGLLLLLTVVTALLLSAWWSARGSEAMTSRFAWLLWVKAIGWAWSLWAVFFALAFLGRYRMLVGTLIVGGLMWAQFGMGLLVSRFGPFELIGDRFAYERFVWPWEALGVTAALIVCISVFGFALGLVRDATLASMLSEKMSAREKMTVTALIIVALMVVGSVAERRKNTDPLHLPGAVDVTLRSATVSAAAAVSVPTPEEKAALQKHANAAAEMLASAGDYLGCEVLPPLFLVHRRDFEKGKIESGDLDSRQGYLVRFNLLLNAADDPVLQSHILKKILEVNQHYRLDSDERGWVLDGFAVWWPIREMVESPADLLKLRKHVKKAAKVRLTEKKVMEWLRFKTDFKPDVAASIAGVSMVVLGESGDEPRRRFLSDVLGYSAPHDFRASLHDAFNGVPSLLRKRTDFEMTSLVQKWSSGLKAKEAQP